jgi:hypothetical protein
MTMQNENAELAKRLQQIIRAKFPTVLVRHNEAIPSDDDLPPFDVFFVPSDKLDEFDRYANDEFSAIAKKEGLPDVDLISHSVADTKLHFAAALSSGKAARD